MFAVSNQNSMKKQGNLAIASALRVRMANTNITQTQLVKATGFQSRTVANLVNWGIGSVNAMNVICAALGLDFTALLVEHLGLKSTPKQTNVLQVPVPIAQADDNDGSITIYK